MTDKFCRGGAGPWGFANPRRLESCGSAQAGTSGEGKIDMDSASEMNRPSEDPAVPPPGCVMSRLSASGPHRSFLRRLRPRANAATLLRGARVAALVLAAAALALGVAENAAAQTTLVSNLDETSNTTNVSLDRDGAQAFTTGATGATVSSVEIISSDSAGDDFDLSLCTTTSPSDRPTSSCTLLTAPSSFAAGTLVFTAPANTTLDPTTTYAVLMTPESASVRVPAVGSNDEDTGGAMGWTIADSHQFRDFANSWRTSTSGGGRSLKIAIKGTLTASANNPPTVANPIDDQTATVGTALDYAFPANTFADTDTGDTLTYMATQSDDSALPAWLSFAAATRTFSGTPAAADVETVSVKVTASDGTDSVSDTFDIVVSAAANNAAMGAPTITGTAQVGQTLTAVTTGITDADGLTNVTYTYQWIRANGTEADIASANSSTYDLVAADLGKTIKVKVSFTDDASNTETLTSAATATVVAAPTAPTVTDVDVTSMPASGDTYGTGERIQYTVTFDQSVTVTGAPEFEFCLGTGSCTVTPFPSRRRAALLSGSGTTMLVFSYTVVAGDMDDNGIWAGNQDRTIKLEGGTIQGTVGGLDAVLTHDEVGRKDDHKVNGASANTAPTAANNTVTTGEDRPYTFTAVDFGFMDADAGAALARVKIVTVPALGTLALDGTAVVALDDVTKAQIDGDMLTFTPALNAHGVAYTTFTFKVNDGTDDSASAYTMTIDVTDAPAPVCTAPSYGDRREIWTGTVTVGVFDALGSVTAYGLDNTSSVGSLSPAGTFSIGSDNFTMTGIAVRTSGLTVFTFEDKTLITILNPTQRAALRLHVCDEDYDFSAAGRTGSSFYWDTSLDWSPPVVTRTVYLSLPENNDATGEPAITGTAQVGQELTADATPIVDTDGLTDVDFTYQWIRVDADGTNPVDITDATAKTYTLATADVGKKVKVKVSFTDNLSGVEERTSAATVTVTAAGTTNTAPTAAHKTVTTGEDRAYTFTADDFGFMDADADDTLASVKIVTVPTPGELALDGTAVEVDDVVTTAQIDGDMLTFTPVSGASGDDYASFLFKVNDGTDDSATVYRMTIDVTAAPRVDNVGVTSMPASGDTYGIGEMIQFTVTFDQDVTVTGTPEFEFCLGSSATVSCSVGTPPPARRSAALLSGSGTPALVFSYTVLVNDVDDNGIYAGNQDGTIKLETGDTIQGTVGELDAVLTHDAVGTPTGHKVNGNTAPGMPTDLAATANGQSRIDLSWTAPASTGGSAITGYKIEVSPDDSSWSDRVADTQSTATTYAHMGLNPATTRYYRVSAINAVGTSDPSGSDDATTEANTVTAQIKMVPADWALKPANIGAGEQFRLMFVSSTTRNATSTDIAVYNTFVSTRAAAGVTAIQTYANDFTALVSTESVNARTNTLTRATDTDAPIYWVRSSTVSANNRVADDYADLYDETWKTGASGYDESGGTVSIDSDRFWTGTDRDGTTRATQFMGASGNVYTWRVTSTAVFGASLGAAGMYRIVALSPVFQVAAATTTTNTAATGPLTITGTAQVGETLTAVTTGIADANGLTSPTYTYQWIRVDGTEVDIASANSSTYLLDDADLGKTIKVKVSFEDDDNYTETLTSAAYPSSGTVRTTEPLLVSASVQGRVLTLVYDEPLDEGSTPLPSAYTVTVTVGTTTTTPAVTMVSVSGRMVTLTLDPAPAAAATVTLTYVVPGTDPVQDEAGNDAPAFSGTAVTRGVRRRPPPPPPTNTPPVVANPPVDQEATTGDLFTYVIPADAFTDADGNPLTYTAALSDGGRLPSWLTFDPATRTFTGTPGPGDGGTVRVTVMASDGTATVSDEFVLMVTVRNTAPVVANPLADQEVMIDVPFTYVVPADAFTDADGDPLAYTAATRDGGLLPSWLTFDPATRTFTGTPASSDSGPVFVTVTASDGTATVSDEFAVRVLMVAPSTLRAWTSRFGRTVATHVTDAVGERLRAPPEQDSQVTVGGYRLPLGRQAAGGGDPETTTDSETTDPETATEPETATDRLASLLTGLVGLALGLGPVQPQGGGPGTDLWAAPPVADPRLGQSQTLQLPTVRLRDVLLGSSFRLTLGDDDAAPGHLRLTAWGRVAGTQFDGRDGALTLDGDVLTGTVGVDSAWDRWLAGVAVSHSLGGGSFTGDGDGDLDSSTLTSIHPYLRYAVNERVDVWSVLGYGWGDLTLEPGTGGTLETDTTLLMGSFGGRGILLSAPDNAGFQLATRTDAMFTRTTSGAVAGLAETEADAHRLRLVLEGSRPVLWPEGQSVTPTVELGVRHDWGDAETGFGLELGGRVQYADPTLGLTIEAAVRGLLTHEDSDYKEWGASGTIRLAPDPNGQGLSLTLAPTWGAASSGIESLWSRQTTAGLAQTTGPRPTTSLNAEMGYGVAAPFGTGLLTPYAGALLSDGPAHSYRLGTRWTSASGLTLNVEGTRQAQAGQQPPTQGLQFQVTWGF